MFAQVADQADDVAGDEPSDGAAGIHADRHPAAWGTHEAGGLKVHRVVVDEGTRGGCDGAGIGAVADGKPQPVPGDQVTKPGGPPGRIEDDENTAAASG
jgi:hypothetical protein